MKSGLGLILNGFLYVLVLIHFKKKKTQGSNFPPCETSGTASERKPMYENGEENEEKNEAPDPAAGSDHQTVDEGWSHHILVDMECLFERSYLCSVFYLSSFPPFACTFWHVQTGISAFLSSS